MEIIVAILLIFLYFWLIYLFFVYVYPWLAIAGAILISGWALVNLVLAVRDCWQGKLPATLTDGPVGPEPAFRQYFFRKAFLDLRDVIVENVRRNREALKLLTDWASHVVMPSADGSVLIFTWPLGVVFVTTGVVGALAALAINLAFLVLFGLFVLSSIAVSFVLMVAVCGVEKAILWTRRFANHCPHPDCYHRFDVPVYECPNPKCRAQHRRLVPGTYGIFSRRCRCGEPRLPTLYLFNRHHLVSYCPNCNRPLEGEDPTLRPVLVPVVAGRSAGKTTFQVSLLVRLLQRQQELNYQLTHMVENDRLKWDGAVAMFNAGQLLPQTLDRVPKALQLKLLSAGPLTTGERNTSRIRLHLYDTAGEAYEDEQSFAQLTFLKHCSGIIMLIDPFSIDPIRERFERELKEHGELVGASDAQPDDVYSRLMEFLEQHHVRVGAGKIRFPLAVVVTKRDAFGLDKELGCAAINHWQQVENRLALAQQRAPAPVDPSWVVRHWLLKQNLAGVIDKLEGQFAHYRYFACSAFGRTFRLGSGKPFSPEDVEAPFFWILRAMDAPR
jgi:hypothetical protein